MIMEEQKLKDSLLRQQLNVTNLTNNNNNNNHINNNTKFTRAHIEHRQLLNNLKSTIDALFLNSKSGDFSWHTSSDGLLCLHTVIEQIFRNGIRKFKPDNTPDIWRFIEGLNWLNPSMTNSLATITADSCLSQKNIHIPYSRIKNDKALCWIYENLDRNTLSQKLRYLISDMEHLSCCYEITAFLRNEKYIDSLFICLTAIEINQSNLLSQIDASLYSISTIHTNNNNNNHHHKRSTSHPEFSFVNQMGVHKHSISKCVVNKTNLKNIQDKQICNNDNKISSNNFNKIIKSDNNTCIKSQPMLKPITIPKQKLLINLKLRPWSSLPNLYIHSLQVAVDGKPMIRTSGKRVRSTTISSQPIEIPIQQRQQQIEILPLTVENLAAAINFSIDSNSSDIKIKDTHNVYKVPSFSYKEFIGNDSSMSANSLASSKDNTKTKNTPIDDCCNLNESIRNDVILKCDDIKIYFDHRQLPSAIISSEQSTTQSTIIDDNHQTAEESIDVNSIDPLNTNEHLETTTTTTTTTNKSPPTFFDSFLTPLFSKTLFPSTSSSSSNTNNMDENLVHAGTLSSIQQTNHPSKCDVTSPVIPSTSSNFVNTFLITQEGEKIQNRYRKSSVLETLNHISPSHFNQSLHDTNLYNINIQPNQQQQQQQQMQQQSPSSVQLPTNGQSLTSYLQAAQFSHANTDLERENAHFNVSEAMISAIEQIKWTEIDKLKKKHSHEERKLNQQRTSIGIKRKTQRLNNWNNYEESNVNELTYRNDVTNDEYLTVNGNNYNKFNESQVNLSTPTKTTTTTKKFIETINDDDATSILISDDLNYSSNSSSSSDGKLFDPKYLHGISVSTHTINEHTAYAEWGGEHNIESLSAEGVALSLISKFSDKQLPRASDLIWLVSEQDAPQQLLPLPGSYTVSPDDQCQVSVQRGTRDWAPPRPQIIFTKHATPDRKALMLKQNQRCAGCGMRVAAAYSHKFRYCEYLGKYHCTGCHRNQISVIPARVLDRWDFKYYPVCVFAYRLLDQICEYPLFRVNDLNSILYDKVRTLNLARLKRKQLKFINDFIMTCRFADESKVLFQSVANHITSDIDLWAMSDFISIKNGVFIKDLNNLIIKCETHIFKCELCMARGFICELCSSKQIIFPWQVKIKRCDDCGNCCHMKCWKNNCTKCLRLKQRKHHFSYSEFSS